MKYPYCHGKISPAISCPNLIRASPYNSKLPYNLPKESNNRTWCRLHNEPCSNLVGLGPSCEQYKHYHVKITITADAYLLGGVEDPTSLTVPLRSFIYKSYNYGDEHPEVSIEYEEVKE